MLGPSTPNQYLEAFAGLQLPLESAEGQSLAPHRRWIPHARLLHLEPRLRVPPYTPPYRSCRPACQTHVIVLCSAIQWTMDY